jgi:NAD(P)-dependent dehydrogenase (short-subunit alcohol dehydrogenase family)
MTPLLEQKNAIVYGAGGDLGGGVARTFAREGARVFLTGRTREPLEAVASDIATAEVAVLDALDERAVEEHARGVASRAGSLDVSFNLTSRGDVQGIPLMEIGAEDFARPVTNGLTATFNTARSAARIMAEQGSGVILGLNSGSARMQGPGMGGTGTADAASEAFLRHLAAEAGKQGVRVLVIYTAAVVETLTAEKLQTVSEHAPPPEELVNMIAGMAMLGRAPRLAQVADVAAFLASDRAAGMTATVANVTCGLVPGP